MKIQIDSRSWPWPDFSARQAVRTGKASRKQVLSTVDEADAYCSLLAMSQRKRNQVIERLKQLVQART